MDCRKLLNPVASPYRSFPPPSSTILRPLLEDLPHLSLKHNSTSTSDYLKLSLSFMTPRLSLFARHLLRQAHSYARSFEIILIYLFNKPQLPPTTPSICLFPLSHHAWLYPPAISSVRHLLRLIPSRVVDNSRADFLN